jgi:ABC-2 type transport system ATP-binding protein
MAQRLGSAAALLDPAKLLFDEPMNGLDPDGIRWVRARLQRFAAEGRTVVASSHLMQEMEATADHVLVIGRGRLIADTSIAEFTSARPAATCASSRPTPPGLGALLTRGGTRRRRPGRERWAGGRRPAGIGDLAARTRAAPA